MVLRWWVWLLFGSHWMDLIGFGLVEMVLRWWVWLLFGSHRMDLPLGVPKRAYLTLTGVTKAFKIDRLEDNLF